jgi:hypothetical protein
MASGIDALEGIEDSYTNPERPGVSDRCTLASSRDSSWSSSSVICRLRDAARVVEDVRVGVFSTPL